MPKRTLKQETTEANGLNTELTEQEAMKVLGEIEQKKQNAFLKAYDELCQQYGYHIEPRFQLSIIKNQ